MANHAELLARVQARMALGKALLCKDCSVDHSHRWLLNQLPGGIADATLRLPCARHLESKISALEGLSTSHSSSQDVVQTRSERTLEIPQRLPKRNPFLIPEGFSDLGFILSCSLSSFSFLPHHLPTPLRSGLSAALDSRTTLTCGTIRWHWADSSVWWLSPCTDRGHLPVPQEVFIGSFVPSPRAAPAC